MELVVKHFNELSTNELYEILKTDSRYLLRNRSSFIRILMIRIRMRYMSFAGMRMAELPGVFEYSGKIMMKVLA